MKAYVLFNKMSGNGAGEDKANKVRELWKDKELIYTDVVGIDYNEFLKKLEPDDLIVVCGGDGTFNRFINDTDGIDLAHDVYFYATGTGSDFWREMGWDENTPPQKANDYIRDLPVVTVKGKSYRVLNGVGYGIDGYCCEVGDKLRETKPNEPINYAGIAIKGLLFHYKPTLAEVTVDGKKYTYKKTWIAPTMNGKCYGGGMYPTPDQKRISDDKKITVMIMHGYGRLRTLMAFPSIFKGEHVKRTKMVALHEGREITVKFDRPAALQIDGETVLDVSEYTMKV
ncbi:MAG: diacylglycerol kinase family protein [Clostridia bacterium]|nr:diacylglycerol kinase family protein [Clostridia bacterium]